MIRDLKAFTKSHKLQKVNEDIITPSSFMHLNSNTLFTVLGIFSKASASLNT